MDQRSYVIELNDPTTGNPVVCPSMGGRLQVASVNFAPNAVFSIGPLRNPLEGLTPVLVNGAALYVDDDYALTTEPGTQVEIWSYQLSGNNSVSFRFFACTGTGIYSCFPETSDNSTIFLLGNADDEGVQFIYSGDVLPPRP